MHSIKQCAMWVCFFIVRHVVLSVKFLRQLYTQVMGPLQLVSHVVQKHLAGEQETHLDKTNKNITISDEVSSLFVLS